MRPILARLRITNYFDPNYQAIIHFLEATRCNKTGNTQL